MNRKDKWTKPQDEFPDSDRDVLILYHEYGDDKVNIPVVANYFGDGFYDTTMVEELIDVVAWMDIPEYPTE